MNPLWKVRTGVAGAVRPGADGAQEPTTRHARIPSADLVRDAARSGLGSLSSWRKAVRASALSLLVTAVSVAAREEPPTVGVVADDNGLKAGTWSGIGIVKTPSVLRIDKSSELKVDTQIAIDNYERVMDLSAAPDVRAEAMRRAAFLRLQRAESGNADPKELQRVIAIYQRLLREMPNDVYNDRAHYQLARAQQLAGDEESAIANLRLLGQRFPASPLAGDGVFRAAELLFVRERYAEAAAEYRTVLKLGSTTPYFQPAEYKYGWSLYKQSDYAAAVPVFLGILDRELPPGSVEDPALAFNAVPKARLELARDSLRVASLSFAALGGGPALNRYFAGSNGEPRFSTLVYTSVGTQLMEKQRYSDAAGTYTAFIERHPQHARAPEFQTRVIDAYKQGGFNDQVLVAKQVYANTYAPGSPYWTGKTPTPETMTALRQHLDDLGRHYQALAQKTPASDDAARKANFLTAANWYRRTLDLFPDDPKIADINLLYADALYDGGRTLEAAQQYTQTAYGRAGYAKAPEAAYAAVQAYQRLATESAPAQKPGVLRESVASSVKMAETFPDHPQWAPALTRAAEDLYAIEDHEQAVTLAQRVLSSNKPLTPDLRRQSLSVVADSRYAQKQYPQAEAAYVDLLKVMDPAAPQRRIAVEQLAASIYKQAEAARDAGDLRTAAASFQRVGRVVPEASIRANADYDAASAFVALSDWPAAQGELEGFRSRYPQHALASDVDKKLADAYEKDNKPNKAAEAYMRVAQRPTETPQVRSDAVWLAANLYDKSGSPVLASQSYEYALAQFAQPLDRALQARRRLADIAQNDLRDTERYRRWLQEIVITDANAGGARSDATKTMAAQASLEVGRLDAARARSLSLTLPLQASLAQRKAATETAIATLSRAASYGFADITTAATFELGSVYKDFGTAIMRSERPRNMQGDELEQYTLLLEEQAYPFEEKAIQAHEANLARLRQGVWNDWIHKSAGALAELAPARYGKNDQRETSYETLL